MLGVPDCHPHGEATVWVPPELVRVPAGSVAGAVVPDRVADELAVAWLLAVALADSDAFDVALLVGEPDIVLPAVGCAPGV